MSRIRHKIPNSALERPSAVLTPEYQREVDRTLAHAEAEWNRAQKRLRSAERRLERAQRIDDKKRRKREVAKLEILVELRRVELERLHRIMCSNRVPTTARGRKSYRNAPPTQGTSI